MKAILAITGILVVIGLIGWYEFSMWNECLNQHSFFYCARTLGK